MCFRICECRQIVPAGTAAALWIRCNHIHAFGGQIVPVLNLLRIACAHKKYDRRCIRGGISVKFIDPTLVNQSGALNQCNVMFECQCDHIGIASLND